MSNRSEFVLNSLRFVLFKTILNFGILRQSSRTIRSKNMLETAKVRTPHWGAVDFRLRIWVSQFEWGESLERVLERVPEETCRLSTCRGILKKHTDSVLPRAHILKEYTKGVYREICWRNPLKEPTENLPEAKSFQRKVFTESRFQMVQKRRLTVLYRIILLLLRNCFIREASQHTS